MPLPSELDDTVAAEVPVARAADSSNPAAAGVIAGRYEVLGLLGVGGMGAVYSVRDLRLEERVALKMVRRELLDDADIRRRFLDEVRLARRVTHRNVARTFDLGEHDGALFLTMELLDGESLGARLQRQGALPRVDALAIARDVSSGLAAAHAADVVHRDLKPDNVFLTSDGRAVVTDFGIARAYRAGGSHATGAIIGTPAYMAPEQVRGLPDIDARADLYALGELIYEMLTGARVWSAGEPVLAMAARLTEAAPDPRRLAPHVSSDLADLVGQLLARDREQRLGSAQEVWTQIDRMLAAPSKEPSPVVEKRSPSVLPPAVVRGDRTLAVLPVRNLGVAEYVARGIHEDLVDTLSTTRGLRVRPIGMTTAYEGSDRDAREIGAALGVQVVVELSVRPIDEAVRLSARAIGVEDGFMIWAERYQRPPSELLRAADEAARAIATALTANLPASPRGTSADPLGVDMYLRARAELRAAYHSSARLAPVAKLFDAAVALAPKDAHALAGAALAHQRLGFYSSGEDSARELSIARDLAERSIALAPQLGESWIALATSRLDAGELVPAVRALHAALRVAPAKAEVREMLGRILLEAGELAQAITLLEGAMELDPSTEHPRWDLGRAYALAGDFDRAWKVMDRAESESGRIMRAWMRARIATWQSREHWQLPLSDVVPTEGLVSGVVALFHRYLRAGSLSAEDTHTLEAMAAGATTRIRKLVLQQLVELTVAAVGTNERALAYLEQAVDAGLADITWMDRCPLLTDARHAPVWPTLRARVDARAAVVRAAFQEE